MVARSMLIRSLVWLSIFCISGCIPGIDRYYRPASSEGRVVRSTCSIVALPKDALELTIDAVVMKVSGKRGVLDVEFHIPESSTVTLADRDVEIYYGDGRSVSSFWSFLYYDQISRRSRQVDYDEPLIGAGHQTRYSVIPRIYSAKIHIDDSRSELFEVHFPSVQVNDVVWEVPVIVFKKETGFVVYPINC